MSDLTISLFACVLFAAGIGLCTYLFLSLKNEILRLRKEKQDLKLAMEMDGASLRTELDKFREGIARLEQSTAELPQLSSPIPGMNTTRRTQALRMHRRGDRPEQIAAALGVARGEVELLLKVQQASVA
jgi:hypothetical protein